MIINIPEFSPACRAPKSARPGPFRRLDPRVARGRFGMAGSLHPRLDELGILEATPHRPSPSIRRWCHAPRRSVSGCRPGPGEPGPGRPMISPTSTGPRRRPRRISLREGTCRIRSPQIRSPVPLAAGSSGSQSGGRMQNASHLSTNSPWGGVSLFGRRWSEGRYVRSCSWRQP